jgi:hypothetical protein
VYNGILAEEQLHKAYACMPKISVFGISMRGFQFFG